jgi:sulfate transport system ATP-binding protein
MIDRIVHLGFEVRIEMTLADGSPLIAQLTRAQVEELELLEGQIVYVEPRRARVFDENGAQPRTEELAVA